MHQIKVGFHEGDLSSWLHSPEGSDACRPDHGAVCSFEGRVRNINHNRRVIGLHYQIHEVMAQEMIRTICLEAMDSSGVYGAAFHVLHAFGGLVPGDISVIVRVSSPHRAEAFQMCVQVMDGLKKRVPVWKKEIYADGSTEWLPGHALCRHVAGQGSDRAASGRE